MESKSLENLEFSKVLRLIAGFAGSKPAQDAVMALKPSNDRAEIEADLTELDELNAYLSGGGRFPIDGLRDLRPLLLKLRTASDSLTGEELLLLRADIETASALQKAFETTDWFNDRFPDSRISTRISRIPTLGTLRREIVQAVSEKGEIRDEASPKLASLRKELIKLKNDIERRLSELVNSSNEIFQDRFFTIRNDRYVVPVRASSQSAVQGLVHDASASGQTIFMEPLEYLPLNNRLARLKSEEAEEVRRILRMLTDMAKSSISELSEMFETLVLCDVLFAKAKFARAYEAQRPTISEKHEINLLRARHPLLHPQCVPLDLTMNADTACIVITGPNGGGKTVALKTVGINALLMQSGCYILADIPSSLPIFDEVLADIGEAQSIEEHLSSFTAHLMRIKEILDICTSNSLVLIDEIGGGTDPIEGAALAAGILKELTRRGAFCLVTSHYDSLKETAFTTPGFANASMEFDEREFKPTFRFLMGVPGRSNAIAVARRFGLPETVLAEVASKLDNGGAQEAALFAALERERRKAEALRRTYEEKNVEIDLRRRELETELKRLEEFRRTKRDAATEEFENKLRTSLKEIEKTIHQLKTSLLEGKRAENDLNTARDLLSQTKQALNELENQREREQIERSQKNDEAPLKPGDIVTWSEITQHALIESLDESRGRSIIYYDGKRISVPTAQLKRSNIKHDEKPVSIAVGTTQPWVREELDLRGLHVEEALEKAENYLKIAEAQKLGRVFLIHGKGTGALQKAIHAFLKTSRWRSKFRFGRYGEGDLGVTVVVFDPAADSQKPDENQHLKPVSHRMNHKLNKSPRKKD